MDYAIIKIKDSQYKVSAGDEVLVDLLGVEKPEAEVLLRVTEKGAVIGTPTISKSSVKMKVLGEEKGEKIRVFKYKSKSRYRKTLGSRKAFTRVKIESLS